MGQARTSYTELSVLADCEQKWSYRYRGPRVKTPPSEAQMKGTLVHSGVNAVWDGDNVGAALFETFEQLRREHADLDLMALDHAYDDAMWLMARYVKHYGDIAKNVKVINVEKRVQAKVPGSNFSLYGYIDRLFEVRGNLWLGETKTMKDWGRLDLLEVDPQITLYDWLAKQNGFDIYGIMFDAIRTYRWALEKPTQKQLIEEEQDHADKRAEQTEWEVQGVKKIDWARAAVEAHPGVEKRAPSESFNMLWLDRTEEQTQEALKWARGGMRRRQALKHGATPLRNIGPFCKSCHFRADCFESMAFPQDITIELAEDE